MSNVNMVFLAKSQGSFSAPLTKSSADQQNTATKRERIAKSPLLGQIDDSGIDQSYKYCIISHFQWEMSKFYKGKLLYNVCKGFPHVMILLASELNISQYYLSKYNCNEISEMKNEIL